MPQRICAFNYIKSLRRRYQTNYYRKLFVLSRFSFSIKLLRRSAFNIIKCADSKNIKTQQNTLRAIFTINHSKKFRCFLK